MNKTDDKESEELEMMQLCGITRQTFWISSSFAKQCVFEALLSFNILTPGPTDPTYYGAFDLCSASIEERI